MDKIRFGRTNLLVSRSGFGAIPIQRISFDEAKQVLRKAYDQGINFFDTARGYSDSEEKIGYALSDVRKEIILATKSPATDKKGLFQDLETSLNNLRTDYIDILQVHNPKSVPAPNGADELYDGLLAAKAKGMIRFIGLTNHRLNVAMEAVASDWYDTIQYPLNFLSSAKELALITVSQQHDVGVIAMKALSGGLITKAALPFAFLRQYANVVPIWGIQHEAELDEILAFEQAPPPLDAKMWALIEQERAALSGAFCRGCGYCMPCPVDIPINMAARMSLLMSRMPYQPFLKDDWKAKMELIAECTECGQCKAQCPYELDTPNLLKRQLTAYREFYAHRR
jgi:predicted aldo/keto reductase-like oxidoreductase